MDLFYAEFFPTIKLEQIWPVSTDSGKIVPFNVIIFIQMLFFISRTLKSVQGKENSLFVRASSPCFVLLMPAVVLNFFFD